MLAQAGFEVITASNGAEALEAHRRHQGDVRVVVLDLKMPVMDGETALSGLRRIDPDARVVLSSGYNEQEVINRFTRDGRAQFVTKPYRASSLLAGIRRARG